MNANTQNAPSSKIIKKIRKTGNNLP